jgi:hypothetical protein
MEDEDIVKEEEEVEEEDWGRWRRRKNRRG